jgi:hypothetical protein
LNYLAFQTLVTESTCPRIMSSQDALPVAWEHFKREMFVLWDEIGLEQGVRATSLSDVLGKVHELLQERVRQEKNVRDQTKRHIQTSASKIITLYKQLEESESDAHEFVAEHTAEEVPLLQSHAALSQHMEQKIAVRNGQILTKICLLHPLF